MAQAKEKADRLGLQNVSFRQGDVGALPFEDGSFDAVLSLNGFHAFPDKEAAYRETFRVLRPGGEREALAVSLTPDYGLAVRYDDGTEEVLRSGEVSVRGLYGYTDKE